jgi:hypothetical protein
MALTTRGQIWIRLWFIRLSIDIDGGYAENQAVRLCL